MAKQRYIKPDFWSDDYIESLTKMQRYFFLYLLTNDKNGLIGVYKLSLKRAALETWLTTEEMLDILQKFQDDHRVYYYEWWVLIRNHIKHQATRSPKIKAGFARELSELPEHIIRHIYTIDTLCIQYCTYTYTWTLTNTWTKTWTETSTDLSLSWDRVSDEDMTEEEKKAKAKRCREILEEHLKNMREKK